MNLFSSILICGNQNNIKTDGIAGNLLAVSEEYRVEARLTIASFDDITVSVDTVHIEDMLDFKDVHDLLSLFTREVNH
ncbi:MAG: hypothetical protein DRQ35_05355, partial [Gammaproteobacteria bacterium]